MARASAILIFFVPTLIFAKVIDWGSVNVSKLEYGQIDKVFKFGDIVKYNEELYVYVPSPISPLSIEGKLIDAEIFSLSSIHGSSQIPVDTLNRNLAAKNKVVKAFKGDIDDLVKVATTLDEGSLKSFSTLDRSVVDVIAQGKTLTNDAAGIEELSQTAARAKIAKVFTDYDQLNIEEIQKINSLSESTLDSVKDLGLEELQPILLSGTTADYAGLDSIEVEVLSIDAETFLSSSTLTTLERRLLVDGDQSETINLDELNSTEFDNFKSDTLLQLDSLTGPDFSTSWKKLSDYIPDLNWEINPLDWDEDYILSVLRRFCESLDETMYNSSLSTIYSNRFHYGLYDSNDTNEEFKSLFSEELREAKTSGMKLAQNKLHSEPSEFNLLQTEQYAEEVFEIASSQNLKINAYSSGWFYMPNFGWMYTKPKIFPFFFHSDSSSFLRYCNTEKGHMFLDANAMVWVSLDRNSLFPIAPFWDLNFYGEELTLDSLNDPSTTPFKYIYDAISNTTSLSSNSVDSWLDQNVSHSKESLGKWLKKFSLKSGIRTNLNDVKGMISVSVVGSEIILSSSGLTIPISLGSSGMYEFLVEDAMENPSHYNLKKVSEITVLEKSKFVDKNKAESFSSEIERYQTIALEGESKYFFGESFNKGEMPNHTRYVHTEILGKTGVKETVFFHTDYLEVFSNLKDHICNKPYTNGWYYTPEDGWLWTDDKTFPFIFRHKDGGWLYFYGSDEKSFFFDYNKNSVVNLNN